MLAVLLNKPKRLNRRQQEHIEDSEFSHAGSGISVDARRRSVILIR
jgi:hypothetical protein